MADKEAVARAAGRVMYERDTCSQALGIRLEEIGPGRAVMSMTIRKDMVNGHNIGHGGMIFTLADATFAYACNSHNVNAVAASCDITFPAPAKLGDRLTAVGEERHLRGRNGVYDVTVTNQDGELVGLFRGRCRRIQGNVASEEELAANVRP
jgi:acyl-CoA thioesterase